MRQCKSTNFFKKKLILLQFLVEPDQSSMVYQVSMINQTLCIVKMLEHPCHGWPSPEVSVWKLVIMKCKLVYTRW